MSKRAKAFLFGAIALAVSLVLGLLLVELGLRIVGYSYPSFYDLDPVRGNALHPGAEGWSRSEGEAYIRINSAGLRDREHDLAKPAAGYRIAVLGDSYAEAMQVALEDTFWHVLESELAACPALAGRDVEVINFGISGHGTGQQLLTLRHRVWDYDPDLVLLAFYVGNDVRNNSRILEGSPHRPYFELRDGVLVLDDRFKERADFAPERVAWISQRNDLINEIRILQLLRQVWNALRQADAGQAPAEGGELGINDEAFLPPGSPEWEAAWQVTEALLAQMAQEVEERGRAFWIMTIASGIQVHKDSALRQRFQDRIGAESLDYPDRRLAALGREKGLSVITLLPDFRATAARQDRLLHGFDGRGQGHWNETGHRLAGELVAARLCQAQEAL